MIIAVSDVHLGYEKCNKEDFLRFMKMCDSDLSETDHLVLVGDILDFWRRNSAALVVENEEILSKLGRLKAKVHYVVGNHDYHMLKLNERYAGNYSLTISKSLRLEDGENKFYFIHGYELEVLENLEPLSVESYEEFSDKMCFVEDNFGWFVGHLWDLIKSGPSIQTRTSIAAKRFMNRRKNIDKIHDLATSPAAYILLGMKPDERLVFGHTHIPFINRKRTVANIGSWVNDGRSEKQNMYVKILNGKMELKVFNEENFP